VSTLPRTRHTSRPRSSDSKVAPQRVSSRVHARPRRKNAGTGLGARGFLGRDVCRARGRVDTKIVSLFLGGDLCHRARVWEWSFLGRDICRVRAKCYTLSGPGRTGFESGPSSGATYVASEQNAISSADRPGHSVKGRTTRIGNRTTEVRNKRTLTVCVCGRWGMRVLHWCVLGGYLRARRELSILQAGHRTKQVFPND